MMAELKDGMTYGEVCEQIRATLAATLDVCADLVGGSGGETDARGATPGQGVMNVLLEDLQNLARMADCVWHQVQRIRERI